MSAETRGRKKITLKSIMNKPGVDFQMLFYMQLFGELTLQECADALGVSKRTYQRLKSEYIEVIMDVHNW